MKPFIKSFMCMKDCDVQGYRDWLETPLVDKIDAVIDANTYRGEYAVVYDYERHYYRRAISSLDVRSNEIPIYFHAKGEHLETKDEVFDLVGKTLCKVMERLEEMEAEAL